MCLQLKILYSCLYFLSTVQIYSHQPYQPLAYIDSWWMIAILYAPSSILRLPYIRLHSRQNSSRIWAHDTRSLIGQFHCHSHQLLQFFSFLVSPMYARADERCVIIRVWLEANATSTILCKSMHFTMICVRLLLSELTSCDRPHVHTISFINNKVIDIYLPKLSSTHLFLFHYIFVCESTVNKLSRIHNYKNESIHLLFESL